MILVDWSQCVIAGITGFRGDIEKSQGEHKENIIRHVILSMLLSYRQKYSKKYGNLVICVDSGTYWRRDYFKFYKGKRKKDREESDFDWGFVFKTMDSVLEELEENFQYKIVKVDKAEADDVIAVMAKWSQENDLEDGMFEEPKPLLIISSDNDFLQLQEYPNVNQWSPKMKKLLKLTKKEVQEKRNEHVIHGDGGDGVPNVLCKDDHFMNPPETTKKLMPKIKLALNEYLTKGSPVPSDEIVRNIQRNKTLVLFENIPQEVSDNIVTTYEQFQPRGNRQKIYNFLIKKRCSRLIQNCQDF